MNRLTFPALLLTTMVSCGCRSEAPPQSKAGGRRTGSEVAVEQRVGAAQFASRCAQCHGSDARGLGFMPNSNLAGLFGRMDEPRIRQIIIDGRSPRMPPHADLGREDRKAELDSLLAYLRGITGPP